LVFGFLAFFGTMKNRAWAYIFAIIFFFQTYYLAFILGMLLSDLMANKNILVEKLNKSKMLRTILLLIGIFLGSYPSGRGVGDTIYAWMEKTYFVDSAVLFHILGAFLVILILLNSRRMQKVFHNKTFLFLGEISFAMYLLHFVLLGSFSSYIFVKLLPYVSYAGAFCLSFVFSCALLFILSYFTHVHIDTRAVAFSKLVYRKYFQN